MQLVERHVIKPTDAKFKECDLLAFKSKNLYNATLYEIRQHYFNTKKYKNYYDMWRLFTDTDNVDYRSLPNKVSKATMRSVDKNFKSFFKLITKKGNGQYDKPINIPDYLHKTKGRFLVHYEKGALSFKDKGFIKLSKTDIKIKTDLGKEMVKFARIVPKKGYYVIEIGYTKEAKVKKRTGEVAGIDLGLNNLMAVAMPAGENFIINGKPLKSNNQYYNKTLAKYRSELPKGVYTSKKIQRLNLNRENKITAYLHQASRLLVDKLIENNVNLLIIGYSKGMKQGINIGKKNNQKFVYIPYLKLIEMIKYKCELEGIEVVIQEESYTSLSSFIDGDKVPVYKKGSNSNYGFSGKRVKRGLYKTKGGLSLNADLNGAYNIVKKYLQRKVLWNDLTESDYIEACRMPSLRRYNILS